jgi:hypothetical protein
MQFLKTNKNSIIIGSTLTSLYCSLVYHQKKDEKAFLDDYLNRTSKYVREYTDNNNSLSRRQAYNLNEDLFKVQTYFLKYHHLADEPRYHEIKDHIKKALMDLSLCELLAQEFENYGDGLVFFDVEPNEIEIKCLNNKGFTVRQKNIWDLKICHIDKIDLSNKQ